MFILYNYGPLNRSLTYTCSFFDILGLTLSLKLLSSLSISNLFPAMCISYIPLLAEMFFHLSLNSHYFHIKWFCKGRLTLAASVSYSLLQASSGLAPTKHNFPICFPSRIRKVGEAFCVCV